MNKKNFDKYMNELDQKECELVSFNGTKNLNKCLVHL